MFFCSFYFNFVLIFCMLILSIGVLFYIFMFLLHFFDCFRCCLWFSCGLYDMNSRLCYIFIDLCFAILLCFVLFYSNFGLIIFVLVVLLYFMCKLFFVWFLLLFFMLWLMYLIFDSVYCLFLFFFY
uniref:NADH dehydrogenase subunit 3 n=1 Tax=Leishmania amazonensis TaxID=5659 RepID=D9MNC6_LEIAM|nr:NADH dehydrogenase subunit 3 [Leishmania amazonensis]